MNVTLLFPEIRHPAIEERYAGWQNELLIRRSARGAPALHYDASRTCRELLAGVTSEFVLVVTETLIVPSPDLVSRLVAAIERESGIAAAVPLMNESTHPSQQHTPPQPYLTLRQFEDTSDAVAGLNTPPVRAVWDESDPGIYLAKTAKLAGKEARPRTVLSGLEVAVATDVYCHRYSSHRGQLREDLLDRIPPEARTILEFGCGEAALGHALKQRQDCRVVGIELDPDAAAVAARRLDAVHSGDVRNLVDIIGERFDWIVGGDILEHLDEPWTFLSDLRKLAAPGGQLLLSVPNVGSWPIVADLLRGRFDYVYMGITCAGHLRFFTRRTIEEMLEISGWSVVSIEPQESFITPEYEELEGKLTAAGITHSREDLLTPGFYVTARNDG